MPHPSNFGVGLLQDTVFADPNSGCWLWPYRLGSTGYGAVSRTTNGKRNRNVGVHRLSYEANYGKIPAGMCICHKCDMPSCVRPEHLYLGTHKQNAKDRVDRGRQARGQRAFAPSTMKLTDDQVSAILVASGTGREIAKAFNVSSATVSMIRSGKIWKHLTSKAFQAYEATKGIH